MGFLMRALLLVCLSASSDAEQELTNQQKLDLNLIRAAIKGDKKVTKQLLKEVPWYAFVLLTIKIQQIMFAGCQPEFRVSSRT